MQRRLILIRHGRTAWNAQRRYIGSTDIALDGEGVWQAHRLKERLSKERISKVFSSDSKRARDFAEIVFSGQSIETTPNLREMDFGIIEGLKHEEIMDNLSDIYTRWIEDMWATCLPKGESFDSLRRRIITTIKSITKGHDGGSAIAIVTHAGPIRVIINELIGGGDFWGVMPEAASISILESDNNNKWHIALLNDKSHYEGAKWER